MRTRFPLIVTSVALVGAGLMMPNHRADAGVIATATRPVLAPGGAEPTGEITQGRFTPDRKWFAFASDADNLVANDTNDATDIFFTDTTTGVITRIVGLDGTQSDSESYEPTICDDGSKIAFTTETDLWDPDFDTNGSSDVYLYDRDLDDDDALDETGQVALYRIGVDPFGVEADFGTYQGAISGDCNWIAFVTADPLSGVSDSNDSDDVYVRHTDPVEEYIARISTGTSATGGGGFVPAISANGRHVVYASFSTDNAPGGGGLKFGYYLRDRDADNDGNYDESGTGRTDEYVNRDSDEVVSTGGPDALYPPSITPDGRCVAFRFVNGFTLDEPKSSTAANAIFVRDRVAGTTEIVSIGSSGFPASDTLRPAISADCRYVAFDVQDSTFFGRNPSSGRDVFRYDLTANDLEVVSVPGDTSAQFGSNETLQVMPDGDVALFSSNAKVGGVSGGSGFRDAFLVDVLVDDIAPTGAALFGLRDNYVLKPRLSIRWSGSDNLGAPTIKVTRRIATYTGSVTSATTFKTTTGGGTATPAIKNGETHCYTVQATDLAGNRGPAVKACTSLPLTTKSLTPSSGRLKWTAKATAKAFGGRYLTTKTKGATITRTRIKATKVAIIVTKCKGCGTIDVYWGNRRIKRNLSLNSSGTRYQQIIPITSFARPTSGTLKIVVTSTNKPVNIEGVGVYRVI